MTDSIDIRIHQQLQPAASEASYELHLAAVEFSLTASILIRDEKDITSREHWSESFAPFEHQIRP